MSHPTLHTAFCERVGIEYPVVLAGMGPVAGTGAPVATAELAAAVSNAGGLGVMGGVMYSPDVLRRRDPQAALAHGQALRRGPAALAELPDPARRRGDAFDAALRAAAEGASGGGRTHRRLARHRAAASAAER